MSNIEILMWCLAYALGRSPCRAEIRRAKAELHHVSAKSISKVIKSTDLLLPYMSDQETSLYKRQICTCMLSAVDYRVALPVQDHTAHGFAICPRCRMPLDRDYQAYCDRCGQHLGW